MDIGFMENSSAQDTNQMSSFAPSHNPSSTLTPDQVQVFMHVMQEIQDVPLTSSRALRPLETTKQFDEMPDRILRLIRDLDIAEGASFFSLVDLNRILSETDLAETEKIIELHKRSLRMRTFMGPFLSEELIQFMTTQERVGKDGKEWFKKLKDQLCELFDQEGPVSIFSSSLNQKKEFVQFLCIDIVDSHSSSINRQVFLKNKEFLEKRYTPGTVYFLLEVGFKLLDKQLPHAVAEMSSEEVSCNAINQLIQPLATYVRQGLVTTIAKARPELAQLFVDAYVLLKRKYTMPRDVSPYLGPLFPNMTALSLATFTANEDNPASIEVLSILLQSPIRDEIEICTQDNGQLTPLLIAVKENNFPATMLLLNANANVNHVGSHHVTPLIAAVMYGNHEDSVIKILDALLKAGADVHVRDAEGHTAFDWVDNQNPNQNPSFKQSMRRVLNQSKNKCTLM